jgi:Bacterial Ig-like domain (group 1)/PKD domain
MKMLSRIGLRYTILAALVALGCDSMPLTAPTGSALTISVASAFVPTGGTTEVTAFVSESGGTPVQNGTTVRFTTNLGRVDPVEVQTRNGYAVATFLAGDLSGVANVRATSGVIGGTTGEGENATSTNSVQITVGGAAASLVVLNASPASVPTGGGTVTITASVLDANGNRLGGIPVSFSTTAGTLSPSSATTDSNGEARVQLTTAAAATVSARAGAAANAATVEVTVTATGVTISADVTNQSFATPFTFTVTPAEGSRPTGVIVDFDDGLSTDLGSITSATTVAHKFAAAGTYAVRVTQTNQDGSISTAVVVVVAS